ncbi:MAG TPA: sigma-54 dependent transcriptional regulator [Longimicrobiaceae bacterium]|nr:sigma-54 dependent transcriptional regulator [Longimicrobiaceae bacterium]
MRAPSRDAGSGTVVITTDELEPAVLLRDGFAAAGYGVELLTSGERLGDAPGDAVLAVVTGGLREQRAQTLIAAARQQRVPVIGLLEPAEVSDRELCRRLGVSECFPKPIEVEEVVLVGRRLVERERLREMTGIVGHTDVMEEVLERVVQIASVDSTVLIQGESGTGKELVARGIHALSRRRHRPFIPVNVAALPETLLESELFGHEKGAFTGAASLRKGLFELAHGGSIFLDEIGEMPRATQTKLLRVLEEREFRRVGGEETLRVDVRVIAATNRSLRDEVDLGEFRRDLYHRLNVLRIDLPPLRERREDIPRLVDAFIREFSRAHDRRFLGIEPEALRILVEYAWPGNVRELRNLVESMVVLAPGRTIRPEDIPPEVRGRRGSLLPVPLRTGPTGTPEPSARTPELEFVLRTLFDLKLDVEDLRRELDAYRERMRGDGLPLYSIYPSPGGAPQREIALPAALPEPVAEADREDAVVFRDGMTMQDLEREAIAVALRRVRGNRRRAAEMLGIGERTLYRKIKEFGLDGAGERVRT